MSWANIPMSCDLGCMSNGKWTHPDCPSLTNGGLHVPPEEKKQWETKDSGKRVDYDSGMRRDTQEGKPRFDLLFVEGMPAGEQFIGRMAGLLTRGAEKYGERNWQLANSEEELKRFRASASRHFAQWLAGEDDEDHAAATAVNLLFLTYVEWKLKTAETSQSPWGTVGKCYVCQEYVSAGGYYFNGNGEYAHLVCRQKEVDAETPEPPAEKSNCGGCGIQNSKFTRKGPDGKLYHHGCYVFKYGDM